MASRKKTNNTPQQIREQERLLKELNAKARIAQDIIDHGRHIKKYILENQKLVNEIKKRQKDIARQLALLKKQENTLERKNTLLTQQEKQAQQRLAALATEEQNATTWRKELSNLQKKLALQEQSVTASLQKNNDLLKDIRKREDSLDKQSKALTREQHALRIGKRDLLTLQQTITKQSEEQEREGAQLETKRKHILQKDTELRTLLAQADDAKKQLRTLAQETTRNETLLQKIATEKQYVQARTKEITKQTAELTHLNRVRAITETTIARKNELLQELKQQEDRLGEITKEAKNSQKALDELKTTESRVNQEKKQLLALKTALDEREKSAKQLLARADIVQKEAEKNKQERVQIEQLRASLADKLSQAKDIDRKKQELDKLQQQLTQDQQLTQGTLSALKEREDILNQTEEAHLAREADLHAQEENIAKEHKLLDDIRAQITIEKNKLADLEHTIGARVAIFAEETDKHAQYVETTKKENKDMLKTVKHIIEGDLNLLREKEQQLQHAITETQTWKTRLEREEETLVKTVRRYEQEEQTLQSKQQYHTRKEQALTQKEQELTKLQAELRAQKSKLGTERQKIARAQHLAKSLPRLEQQHERLQKLIKKARSKLMDATVDPKLEQQILKEKERELEELEAQVERRIDDMRTRERAEHIHPDLHEPIFTHGNVHEELQSVKSLISGGDTSRAARKIAEIEVLLDKIKRGDEKRILSYEVKILKHNLKLADLG